MYISETTIAFAYASTFLDDVNNQISLSTSNFLPDGHGWDLDEWLAHLTANANVATIG